jgi:hypothetical protein
MAAVAKSGKPSICSVNPSQSNFIVGLAAGEVIAAGDLVYIKSDGLVWLATGAAANAAAKPDGMALVAAAVGDAVSIVTEVNIRYGASLTPGARYYLSGTVPGGLDTATSTGGTTPVAKAIDTTRIRLCPLAV